MATISGYPSQWIDALARRNVSISQLPELDLGKKMGETDYIDFLEKPDMISSLMQFTDKYGRKGLAFHLRGKVEVPATVGEHGGFVAMPIRELHAIRTVFEREANVGTWVYADGEKWPKYFKFELIYSVAGAPIPSESTQGNIQWACDIINDTDPVWTLDGEIEQVRDAELPELVLDATVVEPESF